MFIYKKQYKVEFFLRKKILLYEIRNNIAEFNMHECI